MDARFQSYLTLGLRPDASPAEIKAAYRRLAREWHPDRQSDPRRRRQSEDKLREINQAYAALKPTRLPNCSAARYSTGQERPANPAYNPFDWKQSIAEQGRVEEWAESDHSFYDRALTLHFQGIEQYRQGQWQDAISSLMQTVCMVQDNAEGYLMMGRAYRRLGMSAKAVASYQQAARIDPTSADAYYELGETMFALGDHSGAQGQADVLDEIDAELAGLLKQSLRESLSHTT